jgi:hypothetical protein
MLEEMRERKSVKKLTRFSVRRDSFNIEVIQPLTAVVCNISGDERASSLAVIDKWDQLPAYTTGLLHACGSTKSPDI